MIEEQAAAVGVLVVATDAAVFDGTETRIGTVEAADVLAPVRPSLHVILFTRFNISATIKNLQLKASQ